jgi:hypothetical protein
MAFAAVDISLICARILALDIEDNVTSPVHQGK